MRKILNEIKTDDAYKRFYSNIDRSIFDAATLGSKSLLGVSKFILDCIKNEQNVDLDDNAKNAIIQKCNEIGEAYRQLSNEKQIEINNNVKERAYNSLDDLYNHIVKSAEDTKEVKGLTYGPKGLIILYESNDVRITATPTYASNAGNFGWTSWCTASDTCGRYNGYEYFVNYTFATSAGEEASDTYEKILEKINDCKENNRCSILVQLTEKNIGRAYQIEVDNEGYFKTICNEEDEEIDTEFEIDVDDEVKEGTFEILLEAVAENLETLQQAALKYALPEYEKMKKQEDAMIEKASKCNEEIKQNLPSLIEKLKQYSFNDLADEFEVFDEYDWEWRKNIKPVTYYCAYGEDFDTAYNTIILCIGGKSKRMNDFSYARNVGVKLSLAYYGRKFIGCLAYEEREKYEVVGIEGKPYFVTEIGENWAHPCKFYNMQGGLEFNKWAFSFRSKILFLSDENLEIDAKGSSFSVTSNGLMELFGRGNIKNDYISLGYITGFEKDYSNKDVLHALLSFYFSNGRSCSLGSADFISKLCRGEYSFLEKVGAKSPTDYTIDNNEGTSNQRNIELGVRDVENLVSECIKRIIEKIF